MNVAILDMAMQNQTGRGKEGSPGRSRCAGGTAPGAFLSQVRQDCNIEYDFSERYCLNITLQTLLLKHGYLALVVGGAAAGAAGGADYGQDRQGFQGGAGDEDALGVRALVGRVDEIAFRHVLG